ncbi:MAG: hypothetical protein QW051_02320 [Candidatus Aenigmatarchaeota archaeon]
MAKQTIEKVENTQVATTTKIFEKVKIKNGIAVVDGKEIKVSVDDGEYYVIVWSSGEIGVYTDIDFIKK